MRHYSLHATVTGYVSVALVAFLDIAFLDVPESIINTLFLAASLVAFATVFLNTAHHHTRGWCDRCIHRSVRIDGPAFAVWWDRHLRFMHWIWSGWKQFAKTLAVLMVMTLVGVAVSGGNGVVGTFLTGIWALWYWISQLRHTVVAPWCRFCNPRDDGDDDLVDAPTPDPAVYR